MTTEMKDLTSEMVRSLVSEGADIEEAKEVVKWYVIGESIKTAFGFYFDGTNFEQAMEMAKHETESLIFN